MSVRHRALKLAILCSSVAVITGGCVNHSEYQEVSSISDINQNVIAPGTDPVVCDYFSLSTKQVMYYFKHAREVTGHTYADLDFAPCSVTGKLKLKGGITATWEINLSGAGSIDFDDGEVKLLSCERCIPKQ